MDEEPEMKNRLASWSRFVAWITLTAVGWLLGFAFFLLAGGILALLFLGIVALDRRDDLSPWHTTFLEEEFAAGCGDKASSDEGDDSFPGTRFPACRAARRGRSKLPLFP